MEGDNDNMTYRQLSDGQELVLAILPIPSAVLSLIGSVVIITMVSQSRQNKPWTPYHGLLVGMSLCDILFSITLGAGIFLYPQATSNRPLAIGNDATCDAIGFLNQLSYSALLYNAMLGYYFLLSTKYGYSNVDIAAKFETSMHTICLGWPLLTAWAGLFLDIYGERELNIGCWVRKDIPFNCGKGPDKTGIACQSFVYGPVFGGIILVVSLATLVTTNLQIWKYFRNQVEQREKRLATLQRQQTTATFHSEESTEIANAVPARTRKEHRLAKVQAQQHERLKLLRSQAFLFVGGFFFCNVSTYLLRILEARAKSDAEEKELPYRFFFIVLVQAVTFPLQGFINMFVYIRPTYLRYRKSYPSDSKLRSIRRSIFGDSEQRMSIDTKGRSLSQPLPSVRNLKTGTKGTRIVSSSGECMSSTASVPPEVDPDQVKELGFTRIELDDQDDAREDMGKQSLEEKQLPSSVVRMDGSIPSTGAAEHERPQ